MNLIEIELELPEIVKEINEKMKEAFKKEEEKMSSFSEIGSISNVMEKDTRYCIAGGSISNTYMKKPIRDIDVFIFSPLTTNTIEQVFGVTPKTEKRWEGGYNEAEERPYLFRLMYKGYDIEIIETEKQKPIEFDLRFRQFYYQNDRVITTKEAIEDIEKKRIVVVNPCTPLSTYVRIKRFEEQFHFQTDPKSMQYVLWSFNQKTITTERAKEFVEKNSHKYSAKLKEELLQFFEENKKTEDLLILLLNEEKKTCDYVYIKDAKFPYHAGIKEAIEREMGKVTISTFAPNHTLIEEYKGGFNKTFMLHVPYRYYETKIGKLVHVLKKFRLRYITSFDTTITAFPSWEKGKEKNTFKQFLNESFLEKVKTLFYEKEDKYGKLFSLLSGIKPIEDELRVHVCSEESHYSHSLGDMLKKNTAMITIQNRDGYQFKYCLRKCTNGKYTVSNFSHYHSEGSAFYLDIIGDALKEQQGDWFDFRNGRLEGVFQYNHEPNYEYYFQAPPFSADYMKKRQQEFYRPIDYRVSDILHA